MPGARDRVRSSSASAATDSADAQRAARCGLALAALAQHLEAQATRDGCRFDQACIDRIAELECLAGALANQSAPGFIIDEIIGAQRAGRYEAVSTRVIERDEEAGRDHAADAALETRADLRS